MSACNTLKTPDKNLPFAKEVNLISLEGKYQNRAEGAVGSQAVYLSNLIFPNSNIKHDSIDIIEVKKIANDALLVGACKSSQLITSKDFKEARDFKIENGRIWLIRKSEFSFASPAGNPFIGYLSNKQSIGIDEAGNGKIEKSTFLIGTAFVIIPIAGNDKEELRFNRLSPDKNCL